MSKTAQLKEKERVMMCNVGVTRSYRFKHRVRNAPCPGQLPEERPALTDARAPTDHSRSGVEKHEQKITFLMETFPAEFADKRFVAGMDAHVRVQGGAPVEGFPTLAAFMRLFL
ncbi:unnamed protein product [Menidia menidia]|uniref:(Atlantic silverside) hypothetical protein n=1 Tax=Menidia menidia TaxID=238744 RepID=A0A8S4BMZ9_9TELE|nr:unnamed protein product [Menidia menidia]